MVWILTITIISLFGDQKSGHDHTVNVIQLLCCFILVRIDYVKELFQKNYYPKNSKGLILDMKRLILSFATVNWRQLLEIGINILLWL